MGPPHAWKFNITEFTSKENNYSEAVSFTFSSVNRFLEVRHIVLLKRCALLDYESSNMFSSDSAEYGWYDGLALFAMCISHPVLMHCSVIGVIHRDSNEFPLSATVSLSPDLKGFHPSDHLFPKVWLSLNLPCSGTSSWPRSSTARMLLTNPRSSGQWPPAHGRSTWRI